MPIVMRSRFSLRAAQLGIPLGLGVCVYGLLAGGISDRSTPMILGGFVLFSAALQALVAWRGEPGIDAAGQEWLGEGPWQNGDAIVLRQDGALPERCYLHGTPVSEAEGRVHKLRVGATGAGLISLLNWGISSVLSCLLQSAVRLHIPLSNEGRRELRRYRLWSLGLLALACLPAMPAASAFKTNDGTATVAWFVLTLVVLGGAIACWQRASRKPRAVFEAHGFAMLEGLHQASLAGLPEWPFGSCAPVPVDHKGYLRVTPKVAPAHASA